MADTDKDVEAALAALEAGLGPGADATPQTLAEIDLSLHPERPAPAASTPEGLEDALEPAIEDLRDALGEL